MSAEDLEKYETEMELKLYREYRDVVGIFKYVVETDRRFYLCNQVDVKARTEAGDVFFEVTMTDAWVWDMYRPARFAKNVKVLTFKDVNVEELATATSSRRSPEPGPWSQDRLCPSPARRRSWPGGWSDALALPGDSGGSSTQPQEFPKRCLICPYSPCRADGGGRRALWRSKPPW